MSADTVMPVSTGAPESALGARINLYRRSRKLSLRSLAALSQTSAGFLSELERGQANASVGTLRKIADALGISLPDLFADHDAEGPCVLRREHRPVIHTCELTSKYLLSQRPLRNLEVYAAELLPGGSAGEPFAHGDAQEMLVVTAGAVTLVLGDVDYPLDTGDSAEYGTATPHSVKNTGDRTAEVLWIISPPTTGAQSRQQ